MAEYTVTRPATINGVDYKPGQTVDMRGLTGDKIRILESERRIEKRAIHIPRGPGRPRKER